MIWLWLALSAVAQVPAEDRCLPSTSPSCLQWHWEMLHEGLLLEAAYGDARGAILRLERLAKELPESDPSRAQALYWLGRMRASLGDLDGALDALQEGARTVGPARSQCLALIGEIELERSAITRVPARWTFDNDTEGFVHLWPWSEGRGSVRVGAPSAGEDPVLQWTSSLESGETDVLVAGWRHPSPSPRGVRFQAFGLAPDVRLRLVATDGDGRRFTSGVVAVPDGAWNAVELRFEQFDGDGVLSTASLSRLELVLLGGPRGGEIGVRIDDFEVF